MGLYGCTVTVHILLWFPCSGVGIFYLAKAPSIKGAGVALYVPINKNSQLPGAICNIPAPIMIELEACKILAMRY